MKLIKSGYFSSRNYGSNKCNDNHDLDPFIPVVLDSLINLEKIPDSIEQLAGCVFVQNVEAALAVTVPILNRGLKKE